ncbi:GGDEF domain-containing protein [Candidatus Epulonipiscium viviparus]|uniref:GGDEF domain-containing protein n=1 Tax=Candidatus Epulonipiscium viviparus TaxID=420336 RepID=UPI002738084F|nr:diguanylate cyclase [Candidatus Epulopiscium viviparus]
MNLTFIVYLAIFFLHNIIFFGIVSKVLDLKLSKKTHYLVAFINILAASFALNFVGESIFWPYIIFSVFYCLEVVIFYSGYIYTKIAVALTIIVHLLCIEAITVPIMSMGIHDSMNYIMNNTDLLLRSRMLISLFCGVAMFIVLILIPAPYLKKMGHDANRIKVFLTLEITAISSIIATSSVYYLDTPTSEQLSQQIVQGISWLVVEYTGIFMLIGFELLAEHKIRLENKLHLEGIYKNTLINETEATIQVDCTTGKVLNFVHKGERVTEVIGSSYLNVMSNLIINYQVHPEDKDQVLYLSSIDYMLSVFDQNTIKYSFEYRFQEYTTINFRWSKIDIFLEKDTATNNILALLVIKDIHDAKELEFQAERDTLTGLYNKVITENLINQHLAIHKNGILFMIDGDYFKQINDNLGHDIGDTVIVNIAHTLTELFTEDAIVGRVGGDEFMVFITKGSNEFNLVEAATNVCTKLKRTYSNDTVSVETSASVGIAEVTANINDFKDLYVRADSALYTSKKMGRNQFTLYNA